VSTQKTTSLVVSICQRAILCEPPEQREVIFSQEALHTVKQFLQVTRRGYLMKGVTSEETTAIKLFPVPVYR